MKVYITVIKRCFEYWCLIECFVKQEACSFKNFFEYLIDLMIVILLVQYSKIVLSSPFVVAVGFFQLGP